MGKFSGASAVQRAQQGNLNELDLPTGPQEEQIPVDTPETPPSGNLMADLMAAGEQPHEAPDPELQEQINAGIEPLAAEAERQAIPSLAERGAGGPRVDRWLKPPTPVKSVTSQSPDGNMRTRAKAMSDAVVNGSITPIVSTRGTAGYEVEQGGGTSSEIAEAIADEKEGSLTAAVQRAGAVVPSPVTGKPVPAPEYVQVASVVTENFIADAAYGRDEVTGDPLSDAVGETITDKKTGEVVPVTHAQGNAQLGQQIHQEFQRMQGTQVPEKLPRQEAETVGAVFKDMWAANNPDLVIKAVDPATNQIVYQLTSQGQTAIEQGAADRKRLFPKQHVRPSKTPLPTGDLPGDIGENVARKVSGAVGSPKFGNVIKSAMVNMAQVPNVVDKQRAKILFSTILPVLQSGDHSTWQAEINNFGPSKIQKFSAAAAQQDKRRQETEQTGVPFEEELYDPEANMVALADKIAQEVQAVAKERNGANYLSYNVQAFNGRISPQQSFFDPTTSKAVRFVTRNAVPAPAKPGSRIEKNLRQMYAMMLVKGADLKLPDQREVALLGATPTLETWGDRLTEALGMTDTEYEAIAQAIENGVALTDEAFPQVKPLALDPETDADLITAIQSKGEDGPHFIDGLIDFAKYAKAKRAGRPHHSYFNAYIDGKTNGLASNGIQMGHTLTAERTGVIRKDRKNLLDDGDIRDELKKLAIDSIGHGWDGDTNGYESELNDVAEQVFGHRELNKQTTMTFGYGKEIESFSKDIEETVALLSEVNAENGDSFNTSLAAVDEKMTREELAQTLLTKYEQSLREVLSDDALKSRELMRSAAMLHSATNKLFTIKSYVGQDLNFGHDVSTGYDEAGKTTYRLYGEGVAGSDKRTVAHYEQEATSSASRTRDGVATPGEYAYGGSVVGPVQSLDAATVALTASGKSWDRLKSASGNNPYMHTIYDAFKMDAMGYDVVMEEVNKNWLKGAMDWSYLEETAKATEKAMTEFRDAMSGRNPNEALSGTERLYMDWLLKMEESQSGSLVPKNFLRKIGKATGIEDKAQVWKMSQDMQSGMRSVGYNVANPPAEPTVAHLKMFTNILAKQLMLRPRLGTAIKSTNSNKAQLKQEILKKGFKTPSGERIALQYYAH